MDADAGRSDAEPAVAVWMVPSDLTDLHPLDHVPLDQRSRVHARFHLGDTV